MSLKINEGVGVDIIEIDRIKKAFERRGNAFLDRIFTLSEKKYCLKFKDPFPHFAARFAAKEAVVKSFGIGFGKEIGYHDIELLNEKNGKPYIRLSEELNKKLNSPVILVSVSHSDIQAIAFCITK